MEPADKRPRLEEWIRLSDGFRRTEMNVICPVMKAENSIRVFYRLQEEKLTEAIKQAGDSIGLTFENITFLPESTSRGTERNLFVKFKNLLPNDENLCSRFKETLETHLGLGNILVDRVQDTTQTVPQPLISEYDFEIYKLKLCLKELDRMNKEFPERTDLSIQHDNIKSNLEELSQNYTKFAILSQNGKGKSFVLNLLMLMTADNEEEYSENNKNLRMPKDFPDNTLVKNLKDKDLQNLPVVVNQFLGKIQDNNNQDFKSLMQPICHQLQDDTDIETQLKGFSGIGGYFTNKARLDIEPYFLPQKEIEGASESTTKCIVHLRYGSLFEMKVEYFEKSELQQQLYELVTDEECMDEDRKVEENALACLSQRFKILTGDKFSDDMKKKFKGPDDIKFLPEVLEFVGKTELYFGQGKNPTHDRLALQNVLRGLTTAQEDGDAEGETTAQEDRGAKEETYKRRIAAVKKIVVYLPYKILHGGKEILEMPGTDDSDPIAMNFIANAMNRVDAVILLTENGFTLCEKEVKDMLSKSRFIQNFKNKPNEHKVMLLAYPEKNLRFQFSSKDENKIKKLEVEERKKRSAELQSMRKLLELEPVPNCLAERICTSFILPVLHTSILAQAHRPEHEVISKHGDTFLKYTGIQKLMTDLDELVLSRQSSILGEAKRQLSHFLDEVNGFTNIEDAKRIVQLLSNRSWRTGNLEPGIRDRLQKLEIALSKELEDNWKPSGNISKMIKRKLDALVPQAILRWDKMEVRSVGVFSPYFCGKNPRYKVLLYPIIFEDLENEKNAIFKEISQNIQNCLENYKKRAIKQYTEELNTILRDLSRPSTFTEGFVEKTIGDQLDDALKWYLGKKKRPFNMKSMEKDMEKSQKSSLKYIILTPNFKKGPMEEAKRKTRESIGPCMQNVHENFMYHLSCRHKDRKKALSNKLWMPNCTPRVWQQLTMHLKSLVRDERGDHDGENINKMLTMVNASFF